MCGICGFIENANIYSAKKGVKSAQNHTDFQATAAGPAKSAISAGSVPKAPLSREYILEMMMAALIHRGPDQGKSWISETAALGFRRLSIIDLEGSVQPMANETGDLVLVFNGEIYNYQELRRELLAAGHVFSTQGDSEVLLHGYEEWGEHLPEHLRGMFAFAIWDEKNGRLYAARDPFGIKPFYYALTDGYFVFASEIKGILPHPSYQKKLNTEALEQYLSFQYSALEQTFFQGIRQLRPGHFLKYDRNTSSPELTQYFVPELYPDCPEKTQEIGKSISKKTSTPNGDGTGEASAEKIKESPQGNFFRKRPEKDQKKPAAKKREKINRVSEKTYMEQWVSHLDRVIEDSVKTHMAADVEVGAFLSGGVDSSLVASEFTGNKTFTVGFGKGQTRYNEMPLAKELAEELNLSHKGKQISEQEFWEVVPEVIYHMDEPSGDPSAVALYFVSREAARQVKVVVSGEGADELFGGYCIYCEPNALHLYQKLPSLLRKGIAGLASHLPNMRGRSFLIRGSMPVEERFIGNANLFTAKERKRLLKIKTKALSPRELLSDDYEDSRKLDDASRMQYIDLLHWLPGDILQKADRMSMAHSLELRVPYLDREVFEAARYLPANYKQKKQVSKYLFRQVAARHLPAASSNRRKLGFPVPLGHFLTSEIGSEAISRAFHSPAAEKFFQREALDELMAGRGCERGNTNRKLWAVYAFLVWYEIYFPEEADCRNPQQAASVASSSLVTC